MPDGTTEILWKQTKTFELELRVQKMEDACTEMMRHCDALTEVVRTLQQQQSRRTNH